MGKDLPGLDLSVEGALEEWAGDLAREHGGDVTVGLRVNLHLLQQSFPRVEQGTRTPWSGTHRINLVLPLNKHQTLNCFLHLFSKIYLYTQASRNEGNNYISS